MEIVTSSAALALLGGTGFRLVLGYAMDRLKDWQEHSFELARMKQEQAGEAARNEAYLKTIQAEKGLDVKAISVESKTVTEPSFQILTREARMPTGFKYLDMWNSAIRPALATVCILVWVGFLNSRGWVLNSWDLELIAATLGIFIGSRISSTGK